MSYPDVKRSRELMEMISLWGSLKHEYGTSETEQIIANLEKALDQALCAI